MPGSPLDAALSGTARTLTTASVLIGAAALLSLLAAPALKTGTTRRKATGARANDQTNGSAPAVEDSASSEAVPTGSAARSGER